MNRALKKSNHYKTITYNVRHRYNNARNNKVRTIAAAKQAKQCTTTTTAAAHATLTIWLKYLTIKYKNHTTHSNYNVPNYE